MIYVFTGENDYALRQALDEIKCSIGDKSALEANTTYLEGTQVKAGSIQAAGEAMPFLADKRLLIITGLLERFEGGTKSSGRKPGKESNTPEEHRSIADALKKLPESTVVVITGGSVKAGNPLIKELEGAAEIRSFPLLNDYQLKKWILEKVKEKGGTISEEAAAHLAKMAGSDLWMLDSELEKLLAYADGRRIEVKDVDLLTVSTQQASIFSMVDAIIEHRADAAEKLLEKLLQAGDSPSHMMTMLARQAGLIVRAKELKAQKKSTIEIQNRLGLHADFALRKTLEQAQRYTFEGLMEVYRRLIDTDVAIKTGRYDGELALNILAAELCAGGNVAVKQKARRNG